MPLCTVMVHRCMCHSADQVDARPWGAWTRSLNGVVCSFGPCRQAAQAVAAMRKKAPEPEVIDLISDSDEDEAPAPVRTTAAAAPAAGTQAPTAGTAAGAQPGGSAAVLLPNNVGAAGGGAGGGAGGLSIEQRMQQRSQTGPAAGLANGHGSAHTGGIPALANGAAAAAVGGGGSQPGSRPTSGSNSSRQQQGMRITIKLPQRPNLQQYQQQQLQQAGQALVASTSIAANGNTSGEQLKGPAAGVVRWGGGVTGLQASIGGAVQQLQQQGSLPVVASVLQHPQVPLLQQQHSSSSSLGSGHSHRQVTSIVPGIPSQQQDRLASPVLGQPVLERVPSVTTESRWQQTQTAQKQQQVSLSPFTNPLVPTSSPLHTGAVISPVASPPLATVPSATAPPSGPVLGDNTAVLSPVPTALPSSTGVMQVPSAHLHSPLLTPLLPELQGRLSRQNSVSAAAAVGSPQPPSAAAAAYTSSGQACMNGVHQNLTLPLLGQQQQQQQQQGQGLVHVVHGSVPSGSWVAPGSWPASGGLARSFSHGLHMETSSGVLPTQQQHLQQQYQQPQLQQPYQSDQQQQQHQGLSASGLLGVVGHGVQQQHLSQPSASAGLGMTGPSLLSPYWQQQLQQQLQQSQVQLQQSEALLQQGQAQVGVSSGFASPHGQGMPQHLQQQQQQQQYYHQQQMGQ